MVVQSGCLLISAIPLLMLGRSIAIEYKVGNSFWSIPPTKDFYTNWSSSHSFHIGDTLVFDFDSELHDVMQVSRRDYESCASKHPFKSFAAGPATFPLMERGVFYFICSVSNYCALGQRLDVAVHRRSSHSASPPPELQISVPNGSQPPEGARVTPAPPPAGINASSSVASMGVLGWVSALCLVTFSLCLD